ncbi:MAG: SPOR domain-containing protein [Betaproteobacteria bacterium]|nr:SPOR domain-containing protein [Betaproteobacteria bacterium]
MVSRAQPDSPPSSPDPAQGQKQQARRRLIGAIALSLTAVVILSVFFDAEPRRPGRDDVQVRIPARDARLPERPLADAAPVADPGRSGAEERSAAGAAGPGPETTTPPADAPPERADAAAARSDAGAGKVDAPVGKADAPPSKPEPSDAKVDLPVVRAEAATRKAEPPSAKADAVGSAKAPAVKAETAPAKAQKAEPAAPVRGPGHYLQVGAFASEKAASDQVERIRKLGHTAFTERIKTPQGERIRVRLGPYPSRDAADPVRGKLRAAGIDVTLIAP